VDGEVLSGAERRRRWSEEQKREIVLAAFVPGAVVRDVARRADVTPSLIYRWRRDFQATENGFARLLVLPSAGDVAPTLPPVIEVEFSGGARVRIPSSAPPALAAAIVGALGRA
jgi:transposase